MYIETERLIIRNIEYTDEAHFIRMASDGSLNDVGFDSDCGSWMKGWITEARELERRNNPREEYLAYTIELRDTGTVVGSVGCSYYEDLNKVGITYFTGAEYRNKGYASEAVKAYVREFFAQYSENEMIATIREDNIPSWKTVEKVGFKLVEKKLYKDINDEAELPYRFYVSYGNI